MAVETVAVVRVVVDSEVEATAAAAKAVGVRAVVDWAVAARVVAGSAVVVTAAEAPEAGEKVAAVWVVGAKVGAMEAAQERGLSRRTSDPR